MREMMATEQNKKVMKGLGCDSEMDERFLLGINEVKNYTVISMHFAAVELG
jgi:hypothetical protein